MALPIVIGAVIVRAAPIIAKALIRKGLAKKATKTAIDKQIKETGKPLVQVGKQKAQRLAREAAKEVAKEVPKKAVKGSAAARRKARRDKKNQTLKDKQNQQKIVDNIAQKKIAKNIGNRNVPAKRNKELVGRSGSQVAKPKRPSRTGKDMAITTARQLTSRANLLSEQGLPKDIKSLLDKEKKKTPKPKPAPASVSKPEKPKKEPPVSTTKADDPTEGGRYAFYPGQTSKDLGLMYEVDKNKMSDEVRERIEEAELYEGDSKGGRVGKGKKKKVSQAPRGVRAALRGFKPNIGASKGNKRTRGTGGGWV